MTNFIWMIRRNIFYQARKNLKSYLRDSGTNLVAYIFVVLVFERLRQEDYKSRSHSVIVSTNKQHAIAQILTHTEHLH